MGNEEAKDLICMTHGHELRWGNDGGRGNAGQRRIKGRKKWDNCNSIINKTYLKREIDSIIFLDRKVFSYFSKCYTSTYVETSP